MGGISGGVRAEMALSSLWKAGGIWSGSEEWWSLRMGKVRLGRGVNKDLGVHLSDSLESPSFLGEERPGGKVCVEEQMDLISRWE